MDAKRRWLINKLLNTQHLNVPERRELGSCPTFAEVQEIVKEHFSEHCFLPGSVTKWEPSIFCYEGFVLEKTNDLYVLHYQEVGPFLDLRGSVDTRYQKLEYALMIYLQKVYNNKIDGIQIIFD